MDCERWLCARISRNLFRLVFPLAAMVSVFALLLLPLPSEGQQPREITVSAAASLTNAFREVGKSFETRQKGVRISFNFAASGDLLRQIEGGAPVDVFASAASREMDRLEGKGLIAAGTRRDFAGNGVALVMPTAPAAKAGSFEGLRGTDVKRIAIGNPSTVPAGMYAQQVLKYFKVWDDLKEKLIFGESVRQVLDYVARGEVDAGIVFSTDAGARAKEVVVIVEASEQSHSPVAYPIAIVKDSRNPELAKAFVQFVLSADGQRILKSHGFRPAR